ncbi:MAG: beta-ketoacyl synthase N-terminal-like domain-containing protein, partial [Planctomycetota bacterium]
MAERKTIVDSLRARVRDDAGREAFVFPQFDASGTTEPAWSFTGLDRRARALAAALEAQELAGERVLIATPSLPHYLASIYGCFYAGAIAVPVPAPASFEPPPQGAPFPMRTVRALRHVDAIAADAGARAVLADAAGVALAAGGRTLAAAGAPTLAALAWHDATAASEDEARAAAWSGRLPAPDELALLQYTSGSTGRPKGVRVLHRNFASQLDTVIDWLELAASSHVVGWLPLFHDMGLLSQAMLTVRLGSRGVVLRPMDFIQEPLRWLDCMSRHGGVVAAAPSSAYAACVARVSDEEAARLDLSAWRVACNGAEPLRPEVMERFAARFGPAGYGLDDFRPCFGLAEATLMVSAGPPTTLRVSARDLERGRAVPSTDPAVAARDLAASGPPHHDQTLRIVDPETHALCEDGGVGEIWIHGPSVTDGYWNRPEESEETFGARLADSGEGPFLRTGDLGFLHAGELYVTSRRKDLIILFGRNHAPQDLERLMDRAHPAVRRGSTAAFALDTPEGEALALAAEVERGCAEEELPRIAAALRRALLEAEGVDARRIALLRHGHLPRTTSGKVRRGDCRAQLAAGWPSALLLWSAPAAEPPSDEAARAAGAGGSHTLLPALTLRFARRVGVDPGEIDPRRPLAGYGLDSIGVVQFSAELSAWLGRTLSPALLYSHPTLAELAAHLAGERAEQGGAPRGADAGAPIAVVGLACRFPGAEDAEAFWRLLAKGGDAVAEVPSERWDAERWYDAQDAPGRTVSKWMGALEGIDRFDDELYGISAKEARRLDPQHRLLLDVCADALDDAGQVPGSPASGRVGVFTGLSTHDYLDLMLARLAPEDYDAFTATGGSASTAPGRVAYALGLRGPAVAVDTACSSSLLAVHLACQSLRAGECETALAGGVNAILSPAAHVFGSRLGALSPTGRCRAFDADADGTVRGEGCGVVVLKRLEDARAAGDRVLAVIRGSASNQDGSSNGLTAPNGAAQEDVVRQALAAARAEPEEVGYVEAHGAGTPLGDAVEADALGAVLGRSAGEPLLLGSVKTNIGHLEAASGIAGLVKTVLALHRGELPPTLHHDVPNASAPWAERRMEVVTERRPWPAGARLAGVHSLGFSGTNVHVLVAPSEDERAPAPTPSPARAGLLLLSAHDPQALAAVVGRTRALLAAPGAPEVDDLLHTASLRRRRHPYRAFACGTDARELDADLARLESGERPGVHAPEAAAERRRVIFVFPGLGARFPEVARALFESEPVFRASFEACDRAGRELGGAPLTDLLGGEPPEADRVDLWMPALFALQVSLASLWRAAGLVPDAVVGHSLGELAAACTAEALSLEDATRVVLLRSRLMARLRGTGAMAVVRLPAAEVERRLAARDGSVAISAENSRSATVVGGPEDEVERLLADLRRANVFAARVEGASGAGHSRELDGLLDELRDGLAGLRPRAARIAMRSTVTGGPVRGDELDAEYWLRNVRDRVRFADAIAGLADAAPAVFLELSPHPLLLTELSADLRAAGAPALALAGLHQDRDVRGSLLEACGALFRAGVELDWDALHGGRGRCAALPAYPRRPRRYWFTDDLPERAEAPERTSDARGGDADALLRRVDSAGSEALYDVTLRAHDAPSLAGAALHGAGILPPAASVALLLAALRAEGRAAASLGALRWRNQAPWEDGGVELQVVLGEDHAGVFRRLPAGGFEPVLEASLPAPPRAEASAPGDTGDGKAGEALSPAALRARLRDRGVAPAPGLFALTGLRTGADAATGPQPGEREEPRRRRHAAVAQARAQRGGGEGCAGLPVTRIARG